MGTAAFAAPSLRALVETGHTVAAVVTQPDRPHGRGLRRQVSPVKAAALDLGLPVLQPEKASDPLFVAELAALQPEVIVVVAYGQILKPAVLDLPDRGCINVHGSLLPEFRGAGPIQWAILRGAVETGVTTMFMDPGMDTGDVLLSASTPIHPDDTAGTLSDRLAPMGAALLLETLARLEQGTLVRRPQDASRATYAPLLKKEDGAIRWGQTAVEIRNRVHGCNPSPGAYTSRLGQTVKVWRCRTEEGDAVAPPGSVVRVSPLVVAAGQGSVELLEVQPESRGRMTGSAFATGYRIQPGESWI